MTSSDLTFVRRRGVRALAAGVALASCVLTACSAPTESKDAADAGKGGEKHTVTVNNCGKDTKFTVPVHRMLVNDSNILAIALSAGAASNISGITLKKDKEILEKLYGEEFKSLKNVGEKANQEIAIANNAELMFAGWNYGFSEESGFTPDALAAHGIESYVLSESCRSGEGKRGTMDPWVALETDLRNIGKLAGDENKAEAVIADTDTRREALREAPQAKDAPKAFLFDSAKDSIFTSGSFGGPQAVLETAGARNVMEKVKDTWTRVGWEDLAAAAPDVFVFVEYPGQTLDEKIKILREHPATRNLPAVKENRFINLPYLMWTSGPQNIDAAEIVRKGLESFDLLPKSSVTPKLDINSLDLPGNEWARK